MIRAIHKRLEQRDEGFTLIELLVVVIIIGILAAIAIPVFLAQRERAWRSGIQSDLRNAAVAQETYYTDEGDYTATLDPDLTERGYNPTVDVGLTISTTADGATFTDGQVYCLRGRHANLGDEDWYLGSGGTLDDDEAEGCPQATDPAAPTP